MGLEPTRELLLRQLTVPIRIIYTPEFLRDTFPGATASKLCLGGKRVTHCQLPTISISAHFDFRQGPPSISPVGLHCPTTCQFEVNRDTTTCTPWPRETCLGGETRTHSLRAPDATVYQLTLHPDDLVRMGRFELPAIRVTAFSTLPVYQFPAHPHVL